MTNNIIKMRLETVTSKVDASLRELKQSNFDAAWNEHVKKNIEFKHAQKRRERAADILGKILESFKEEINKHVDFLSDEDLDIDKSYLDIDKSCIASYKEAWMNYYRYDAREDKKIESRELASEKLRKAWLELLKIEGEIQ